MFLEKGLNGVDGLFLGGVENGLLLIFLWFCDGLCVIGLLCFGVVFINDGLGWEFVGWFEIGGFCLVIIL